MNKKDLRKYIRLQKQQFTSQQLVELSLPIMKKLMVHPRVKSAKTILMYYSLSDEVNTHEVIDELVAAGKTVLLPST